MGSTQPEMLVFQQFYYHKFQPEEVLFRFAGAIGKLRN